MTKFEFEDETAVTIEWLLARLFVLLGLKFTMSLPDEACA